jgi:hypothetical protein
MNGDTSHKSEEYRIRPSVLELEELRYLEKLRYLEARSDLHSELYKPLAKTMRQHKAEAETVRKGYPHLKRNKSGHTFKGRPQSEDPPGMTQVCSCGITLYDWRCKWIWRIC